MERDAVKSQERLEILVDLESCLCQAEASKDWFASRVLSLTPRQLRWRPEAQCWSIGECLDHLNIVLARLLPQLDETLARSTEENGTFSPSLDDGGEDALLRGVELPVTLASEAPMWALPPRATDPDRLVEVFPALRDQYADAVRRSGGRNRSELSIAKPFFPAIRSLAGMLAFLAAHDRRHIWQAEQVRKRPGFP